MIKFNAKYFCLAIALLLIETAIALFLDDRIIRPLVGDVLVIPLIYCVIKAFWPLRPSTAALFVFAFACLIEAYNTSTSSIAWGYETTVSWPLSSALPSMAKTFWPTVSGPSWC
jgi:hypothetical protein